MSIPHGVPFTEYILEHAGKYGDKPAFVDGVTGATITYAELGPRVSAVMDALTKSGFNRGDVLCLHLPNCPEYMIAVWAVAALGGTTTTANPMYTAEELSHQLKDSNAKFLITAAGLADVANAASALAPTKPAVSVLGKPDCPLSAMPTADTNPKPKSVEGIDPHEQLFVLPYSSGTTGLPKGVMLSHTNVAANVNQITQSPGLNLGIAEGDVVIGVLPAFHIYGLVVVFNSTIRQGATVVTLPKFEPKLFLDVMQKYKVSFAPLVPPLVLFLAKHPMVGGYNLDSVEAVFSGAAPLDAELQKAVKAVLKNAAVRQGYGMTELSPVSHCSPADGGVMGTIGFAAPNVECRIVDPDTCEDVPMGHAGELWVRGPGVMKGYLNNPTATKATITEDGFLRTGDMAIVDADGYFSIVDRLKELIKVKGFQVAPAELEGILHEHPAVADVAVLGIPDERAGEAPLACIVLKPGAEATADEISEYVAGRVADYKRLGRVKFVEAIPKSAAGKILRRVLKAQL